MLTSEATSERRRVRIAYDVEEPQTRWLLDEEDTPESTLHDQVLDLLKLILLAWVARARRPALVARNFACRWDPSDARVGVDPDLVLVEPAPPGAGKLAQLRIWEPGHTPPRVGVEVVSPSSTEKDYHEAPARYGCLGVSELWVFDPSCEGPSDTGGPFVLQIWRRHGDEMRRVYAGAGPVRTEELDAWLVVTDDGTRLRLAEDAVGTRLWPTQAEEEAQRANEQAQRAEEQAKRADAAEREIEALRRALAERGTR
jgi:Uma2 family endonuclease